HVYDLTWLLPEHPIDYEHYLRDHGVAPVFSGEVGVFLKALFGYSSMPSIEEIIAYIGYFVVIYLLVTSRNTNKKNVEQSTTVQALEPKTKKVM
ncbi:iron permease, partial [Parageobacillus sp. SY1]